MVIVFGKFLNVTYVVIQLNIFVYLKIFLDLSKKTLTKDLHVQDHPIAVRFVAVVTVDAEVISKESI